MRVSTLWGFKYFLWKYERHLSSMSRLRFHTKLWMKEADFVNSLDPYEAVHNESPHLYLYGFPVLPPPSPPNPPSLKYSISVWYVVDETSLLFHLILQTIIFSPPLKEIWPGSTLLSYHLHLLATLLQCKTKLFHFWAMTIMILQFSVSLFFTGYNRIYIHFQAYVSNSKSGAGRLRPALQVHSPGRHSTSWWLPLQIPQLWVGGYREGRATHARKAVHSSRQSRLRFPLVEAARHIP